VARRKVSRNYPLEWKTDVVAITDTTSATPVNGEFDLDLLPDEIAEIVGIHSQIDAGDVGKIDNVGQLGMYLSMDPDADDDPLVMGKLEDLEVFFTHHFSIGVNAVTAASVMWQSRTSTRDIWLPDKHPLLIGTNFSQVVNGASTVDILTAFMTTIYFRRRRASQADLANILLKRR